jgi:ribosomal protein L11 methyltransferase
VGCVGNAAFDVVLCNMISAKSLPLVGDIRRLLVPGGTAVFSGLLGSELKAVSRELAPAGLVVCSTRQLGEWLSLTVMRERAP